MPFVTVTGSFVDPGSLDTVDVTVNWGDGSALSAANLLAGLRTFSFGHDYATPGVFEITVTIEDDDSGVVVDTTTAFLSGVSPVDGVLYIIGTADDDRVRITTSESDASVASGRSITVEADFPQGFEAGFEFADVPNPGDHWPHVFDAADIDSIVIRVSGGDDHVQLDGDIDIPLEMTGGAGNDTLALGDGVAVDGIADGGEGTDTLDHSAWTSPVTLNLTVGSATGLGSGAPGRVMNFENAIGGSGDDTLTGDAGDNVLDGGPGGDTIVGLLGDDTCIVGSGDDFFYGGGGFDTADFSLAGAGIWVRLATHVAYRDGFGGRDELHQIEGVIGSAWDDFVWGDDEANRLDGGPGDDTMYG